MGRKTKLMQQRQQGQAHETCTCPTTVSITGSNLYNKKEHTHKYKTGCPSEWRVSRRNYSRSIGIWYTTLIMTMGSKVLILFRYCLALTFSPTFMTMSGFPSNEGIDFWTSVWNLSASWWVHRIYLQSDLPTHHILDQQVALPCALPDKI